jgi:hypothetical protein
MSVSYAETIVPDEWRALHAYLFPPSDAPAVAKDIDAGQRAAEHPHRVVSGAATMVTPGAEVTVIPNIAGVEFRPTSVRFYWQDHWHRADFEARYTSADGHVEFGTVSWFVGPVCIGQVFLQVQLAPRGTSVGEKTIESGSEAYQSVFVSYSHNDRDVVDWLETAYAALGMEYLRDVKSLRSGENWSEQLVRLIDRADLFQLCWSTNASGSRFVEQEWRHALSLNRLRFIRPLYWEEPIAPPPSELSGLHFARLELPRQSLFRRMSRHLKGCLGIGSTVIGA